MARSTRKCNVEGCDTRRDRRGYCKKHLTRLQRFGDVHAELPPQRRNLTPPEQQMPFEDFDRYLTMNMVTRVFPKDTEKAIKRARERGWFREDIADKIACEQLKVHPALIWGDRWFWPEGVPA